MICSFNLRFISILANINKCIFITFEIDYKKILIFIYSSVVQLLRNHYKSTYVDTHVRIRAYMRETGNACKIPVDLHEVVPLH